MGLYREISMGIRMPGSKIKLVLVKFLKFERKNSRYVSGLISEPAIIYKKYTCVCLGFFSLPKSGVSKDPQDVRVRENKNCSSLDFFFKRNPREDKEHSWVLLHLFRVVQLKSSTGEPSS